MSTNFRLPFGKFKGSPIVDVPLEYLIWVVDQKLIYAEFAQREIDRRKRIADGRKIQEV